MSQLMFKKHSNRKRKVLLVIKLLVILISLLSCKKKEKDIEFIGGENTYVKLPEERKRMTLGKWKFTNLIYISKNDLLMKMEFLIKKVKKLQGRKIILEHLNF